MSQIKNKLHIATHNGIFHADEITAVALLEIFLNKSVHVSRLPHNHTDFNPFDMVIDIGKKSDNKKFFDHHQYKGGKSSAGLLWSYIGLEKEYKNISELIKIVDAQDTGVKRAKPFEYPNIIKSFNHTDIYSSKQDEAFLDALYFAKRFLLSLKNTQEEILKAKEIVSNSFFFEHTKSILELEPFTPYWQEYINKDTMPNIKAVVWEDKEQNKYKIKVVSNIDVFLSQSSIMEFVHTSGFFGVAKDKKSMKKYITEINI